MNTNILKGKTVLLTGATGGIGQAIARKLAECGCNLILTSKTEKKLLLLSSSLMHFNVSVNFYTADLRNLDELYDLISYTESKCKGIDILINTAGIFNNSSLNEIQDIHYQEILDINLRPIFILSREFSKGMVNNKWGRIVNIGSSSSYFGWKDTSLYCTVKHAVLGFSRSLQIELRDYNVRTYCVSPGSTLTNMGKKLKNQDLSTFIEPDEVAEYVVFSISFDSNSITNEISLNRMKY